MDQQELIRRFLEHRDTILAFIFSLTLDYDVAEEVFQNVATAVLQERDRAADVGEFSAWVRQVARHRVADYYRQHSRRSAVERPSGSMADIVALAFDEQDITPQANHLRMKSLLACLQKLSGRSREVIEGFYRDRKSVKDLAASMAWKEGSVKVALSRARKVLADCIAVRMRGLRTG
jgi:RNA polymerase sigma-70 factor (ECF subfamily)